VSKKIRNYDPERISNDDTMSPKRVFVVEDVVIGPATLNLSESDISGKDATEIRRMVELTQSAFRRSAHIAKELEEAYTDEKAIAVAHDFFKHVYHIVVMNCLYVYVARTEDATDEARAEGERLGQLERDLNGQWDLTFVDEVAENLWEVWLTSNGPKSAADFGRNLQSLLLRHLVAGAILTVEAEKPQEALEESWDELVWRTLHAYDTKAILDDYYKSHIYGEAEELLENVLKPAGMPFEELRLWAGISFVENSVAGSRSEGTEAVKPYGLLNFPADHAAFSITQYLAGRIEPTEAVGNLMKVAVKATRGQQRELAVGEALPPELLGLIAAESVEPTLARIREDRNETKAKVFVGALALASQQGVDPERFFVSLADLMLLVTGYNRSGKSKIKPTYYWSKAAEIIRYLILDLASTTVHIQVKLPHYKEALNVQEWLMHRPRPAIWQTPFDSPFTSHVISLVNQNATTELANYVKSVNLEGFFLGFPKGILDALGVRTGKGQPNAIEQVPWEVLKLKGPAFWLAYDIVFLRRWARPQHATAAKGKSLLETLEKHGYLEKSASRTGGRVSYKSALGSWFKDIDILINLDMLEDPGVSIYEFREGRWYAVTHEVSDWLKDRGIKITRDKLTGLHVIYYLPQERIKELAKLRAKRKKHRKT
jgi:hypothetical protein